MSYYWKIWSRVMRMTMMRTLAYKLDYLTGALSDVLFVVVQVGLVVYIFRVSGIRVLAGFNMYQILFVSFLSELILYLSFIFIAPNVRSFEDQVHNGELDMFLTKPQSKFLCMFQNSWLTHSVVGLVVNFLLLGWLWTRVDLNWSDLGLVLGVLMLSVLIYMWLNWIVALIRFYFDRFEAVRGFIWNIYGINNYPRQLYPRTMRSLLTYVVPVFLVANPMYNLFAGTMSGERWLEMAVAMVVLWLVVILMWQDGVRRYNSAA